MYFTDFKQHICKGNPPWGGKNLEICLKVAFRDCVVFFLSLSFSNLRFNTYCKSYKNTSFFSNNIFGLELLSMLKFFCLSDNVLYFFSITKLKQNLWNLLIEPPLSLRNRRCACALSKTTLFLLPDFGRSRQRNSSTQISFTGRSHQGPCQTTNRRPPYTSKEMQVFYVFRAAGKVIARLANKAN